MIIPKDNIIGGNTVDGDVNQYYSEERGISVINGNSLYWIGNIALMYPSDYIYSFPMIDSCYNHAARCRYVSSQGWIFTSSSNSHQWLLMPSSEHAMYSFLFIIWEVLLVIVGDMNLVFVQPYIYLLE